MRPYLAVDTNLLVLFVVGATALDYISKHKKLYNEFCASDYAFLQDTIANSSGIIVTPHVLAETSNLLAYVGEPAKSEIFMVFKAMIAETKETLIRSAQASTRDEFSRLGLTDAALLELCGDDVILLTCDTDLWLAALNKGLQALNFTHMRDYS